MEINFVIDPNSNITMIYIACFESFCEIGGKFDQSHRLDPEKLGRWTPCHLGSEPGPGEPASDFVDAILDFFSTHMKVQYRNE